MKSVCIVGAGAIGSLIGGKLAQSGQRVQFVARGPQLQALTHKGLLLRNERGEEATVDVQACDDPAQIGPQDAVFLCTKSHQLPEAVERIAPLLHKETVILPVVNGIPWWYCQGLEGPFCGRSFKSLDPEGKLAKHVAPERIIGTANYLAATRVAPGVVHYLSELERTLVIGEPSGAETDRLDAVRNLLAQAGMRPEVTPRIRDAIWHKLWGNIAFNPVSALTHATMDAIAEGYQDMDLIMAIMHEARLIAEKVGAELEGSARTRIAAAAKIRGHKTSMLQDIEAGRKTEIEAIVGAVREMGLWMEESTPHLNSLYSLVKQKERFYEPERAA